MALGYTGDRFEWLDLPILGLYETGDKNHQLLEQRLPNVYHASDRQSQNCPEGAGAEVALY